MDKLTIIMAAILVAGSFWLLTEVIKSTKRWIKKEREEWLRDE